MSRRPISASELIKKNTLGALNSDKPRYISKKEREQISGIRKTQSESNRQKVRKTIDLYHESNDSHTIQNTRPKPLKPKKGKFKFGWDNELEDVDYNEPLLEEEPPQEPTMYVNEKHWSEKGVEEMTSRDWRIFKEDFAITYRGDNIINPLRRWSESKIPREILDLLVKTFKYSTPTPIQRASIPIALSSRDVLGIAETGSGKTLAYLIPLLSYLMKIDKNYIEFEHKQDYNKTLGLVLAPTRELALQISEEARKFAKKLGLNVVTIIGGHQYEENIHSIDNGVHIVVATPGRLVDSIERRIVSLSKCYYFVLDEVDRMIDMGFEKPLQTILDNLPPTRQLTETLDSRIFNTTKKMTLMFTATMTPVLEGMTQKYLESPAYVSIGGSGEAMENIDQKFDFMEEVTSHEEFDTARYNKMLTVINRCAKEHRDYSIIIFANFKRVCDTLSEELTKNGHKNAVIHGSKSQEVRERVINQFKARDPRILIATDVAARGLDVPNVSLVINFQMSNKFEEYVHRIGRTGRAGKRGASYTFLDNSNMDLFNDLRKFLVKGRKKVPEWLAKVGVL